MSIPQRGGCKTPQRRAYERSPAFKQGQRFRAGLEGRISVLMRDHGMKRCCAEGAERFALFVGAAVLANNLMIIGGLMRRIAGDADLESDGDIDQLACNLLLSSFYRDKAGRIRPVHSPKPIET